MSTEQPTLRVAIAGGTGVIGSALAGRLRALGHSVTLISRKPRGPGSIVWDPAHDALEAAALLGHDAVVNLAGESIRVARATRTVRRRFRNSRVLSTGLLARRLAEIAGREGSPSVLISMCGTHVYGDRGDEILTEDSPLGTGGFLTEVSQEWEAATRPAGEAGLRVITLRTGAVQAREAASVRVLLPLYRLGLAGPFGSGQQFLSWITLPDLVAVILHGLADQRLAGPVNATAPEPVRQIVYARTLARLLRRPAILPVPRFGPKLVLGSMIDDLLFSSQRVLPQRLQEHGFAFRHEQLHTALAAMLERR